MDKSDIDLGIPPITSRHITAVDLETTGLCPWRGHRVIEVGAVVVDNGSPGREFHSLVNPGRPVPPSATLIHGITTEMLQNAPHPETVFDEFRQFFGDSTLIAHNAPFDISFIQAEMALFGRVFYPRYRCTLKISRQLYPELPNYRLKTVACHVLSQLSEDTNYHRALDDARLVAGIWLEMMKGTEHNGTVN